MTEVFDKLLASRPVNRQAARVLAGGVHYKPNKKIVQRHWTTPPPLVAIPESAKSNPCFVDLTGRSFGRFRVIGYLGKSNNKASWLVRCACGDFETRRSRAILNPENYGDRCANCQHLAFLKREEIHRRNPAAPQPDIRDF